MGTTGRFGGGGHGLTGPKHIWYDTDYSELYKGLAVVIGFFLFLVLLLLVFILISYLRKWYRLKKRPTDAVSSSNNNSNNNQHPLQHHPFNQKGSVVGPGPGGVSSVKNSLSLMEQQPEQLQLQQTKYCKKHSRVGLPPQMVTNHSNSNSQPQTPLSNKLSLSGSSKQTPPTMVNAGAPVATTTTALINPNMVVASPIPPNTNIELIHDPNIVIAPIGAVAAGGGGVNPASSTSIHHHHSPHPHYQEFPPQPPPPASMAGYPVTVHPSHVITHHNDPHYQARKDSRSSMQTAAAETGGVIVPGRSSLATITLS